MEASKVLKLKISYHQMQCAKANRPLGLKHFHLQSIEIFYLRFGSFFFFWSGLDLDVKVKPEICLVWVLVCSVRNRQ